MKKALSCILVLALFLSLGVFGTAFAEDLPDFSGTYELTRLEKDGEDVTEDLTEGKSCVMIFYADGTGYFTLGDEIEQLTWDATTVYDQYGMTAVLTVEDGILTMDDGYVLWTFQRIGDAPEKEEASGEENGYVGVWTAVVDATSILGEQLGELPVETEAVEMELSLELRSDSSFIMSLDAEVLLPVMRQIIGAYLEITLSEMGMTAEEFEAASGKSLEDLIDETMAEANAEDLFIAVAGTYEVSGDEIVLHAESGEDEKGSFQDDPDKGRILLVEEETVGEVCFERTNDEDVLAKSEGVMTYAEYAAAEMDSPVVIEAYVLDHQSWWSDQITVYAQDADGAYFLYNMACSEEDAAKLVPGQKIRVTGYKSEWAGEVEIVDASFEFLDGSYSFRPVDVTALLGTDELIDYQNRLVTFKGMTVEPYDESGAVCAYKDPDRQTDDLYFKVSKDGVTYEFCVEYYLRGNDTEVYQGIEALNVGDTVDLTGYLYWYEGPNPHIISVAVK